MENQTVATAAERMAARPMWVDHACEAWGRTVRLCRLTTEAYLGLAECWEAYPRDGAGVVSKADRYAWACEVVAACVVDVHGVLQFAEGVARQWLGSEPAAVRELVNIALVLNGLGSAEDSDADSAGEKKSAA